MFPLFFYTSMSILWFFPSFSPFLFSLVLPNFLYNVGIQGKAKCSHGFPPRGAIALILLPRWDFHFPRWPSSAAMEDKSHVEQLWEAVPEPYPGTTVGPTETTSSGFGKCLCTRKTAWSSGWKEHCAQDKINWVLVLLSVWSWEDHLISLSIFFLIY